MVHLLHKQVGKGFGRFLDVPLVFHSFFFFPLLMAVYCQGGKEKTRKGSSHLSMACVAN